MPCHQLPPWPVPTVILLESGGVALEVLAVVGRFRASLDIGINRGLKSSVVTVALGAACHHALVVLAHLCEINAPVGWEQPWNLEDRRCSAIKICAQSCN